MHKLKIIIFITTFSGCSIPKQSVNIERIHVSCQPIENSDGCIYKSMKGISLGDIAYYCIDTVFVQGEYLNLTVRSMDLVNDPTYKKSAQPSFLPKSNMYVFSCKKKGELFYPKNFVGVTNNNGRIRIKPGKSSYFLLAEDSLEKDMYANILKVTFKRKFSSSVTSCRDFIKETN